MANLYLSYNEVKKQYPKEVAIVVTQWKGKKKSKDLKWSFSWGIEISTKPLEKRIFASVEAVSQGWVGSTILKKIPKEILDIEKEHNH